MMNDGNCKKCGKYAGDCICQDGVASLTHDWKSIAQAAIKSGLIKAATKATKPTIEPDKVWQYQAERQAIASKSLTLDGKPRKYIKQTALSHLSGAEYHRVYARNRRAMMKKHGIKHGQNITEKTKESL